MADASEIKNENNQLSKDFLAFSLAKEYYAISIDYVLEMSQYIVPTPIGGSEGYFLGIIHLRDNILPIIDLRIMFNLGQSQYDQFTIFVILKIKNELLGIVVDSVEDMIRLSPEAIYQLPDFPSIIHNQYIQGFFDYQGKIGTLLNIEKLMLENLKVNKPINTVDQHGI